MRLRFPDAKVIACLALVVLFLIANRAAWKGYFSDDDLDNLSWTSYVQFDTFAEGFATPKLSHANFRPAGHIMYFAMGRLAGLDFRWYVALIQCLHLLNVFLVWRMLRRLCVPELPALAGVLIFIFHFATFAAHWKPMYIFDVVCGTFTLLCLLAWIDGRWLVSLICFWLAFKSKEVAIGLPVVLAAYEWLFGTRRWLRVLPFFAVSTSFGVQAIFLNRGRDDDYSLRFTLPALWTSMKYYAPRALFAPLLAIFTRSPVALWGLVVGGVLIVPMLFLPARLYSVYLYVPMIGLTLLVAEAARKLDARVLVTLMVLWLGGNFLMLRRYRNVELAVSAENRRYVAQLAEFLKRTPDLTEAYYDGRPAAMNHWGIEGSLRYLSRKPELILKRIESSADREGARGGTMPVLVWNQRDQLLTVDYYRDGAPPPFLDLSKAASTWFLDEGWYRLEGGFRWTNGRGKARLTVPLAAAAFEITVNVGPELVRDAGRTRLDVHLAGKLEGSFVFDREGRQTVRLPVRVAPGTVVVELLSTPVLHPQGDTRALGIPVVAFGFVL